MSADTSLARASTDVSPFDGAHSARRPQTRGRVKLLLAWAAATALLVFSIAVAITLGPADVSLVNVRDIVLNHAGLADIPVRVSEDAIVWQERLPRALVAAATGTPADVNSTSAGAPVGTQAPLPSVAQPVSPARLPDSGASASTV